MKRISILAYTIASCLSLVLAGCDKGAEERTRLQQELAELKIASQETSSERDTLKTDLAAATKARDGLQEQVSKLTGEEATLRGQIDELTSSSQRLGGEVTKLTESIDKLTGQLKEVTESRNQLQKDVAELKSARDDLQAQVLELITQRDDAVEKEQQAQRELAMLTARLKAAGQTVSEPNDGLVAIGDAATGKDTPVVEGPEPPTIHSFASARAKVDKGQSATLTWHVSNASEIYIEPGVGSVSALGSTNVKPTKNTTYTLTAINDGGKKAATCTVEVR